jgi:hypothetical protein
MLEVSHARLGIFLQSHGNKSSMALAQKQTYRLMEEIRRPRTKPTQLVMWFLAFDTF